MFLSRFRFLRGGQFGYVPVYSICNASCIEATTARERIWTDPLTNTINAQRLVTVLNVKIALAGNLSSFPSHQSPPAKAGNSAVMFTWSVRGVRCQVSALWKGIPSSHRSVLKQQVARQGHHEGTQQNLCQYQSRLAG